MRADINTHYSAITSFMHTLKGGEGCKYSVRKYNTLASVELQDDGESLVLVAGVSRGKCWATLKFNPGQMADDGWDCLNVYLDMMGFGGLSALGNAFGVSKLEFAADVMGMQYHRVHALDLQVRSSKAKWHDNGTLYLGRERSARQVVIYDKAKQMREVEEVELGHELLRVEARISRSELRLCDLRALKNPFAAIRLFTSESAENVEGGAAWNTFRTRVAAGIQPQDAYLSLSPIGRRALETPLRAAIPGWWDATAAWDQARAGLNALLNRIEACPQALVTA